MNLLIHLRYKLGLLSEVSRVIAMMPDDRLKVAELRFATGKARQVIGDRFHIVGDTHQFGTELGAGRHVHARTISVVPA